MVDWVEGGASVARRGTGWRRETGRPRAAKWGGKARPPSGGPRQLREREGAHLDFLRPSELRWLLQYFAGRAHPAEDVRALHEVCS